MRSIHVHNILYKILLACCVTLYPLNMASGAIPEAGVVRIVVSYNTNQVDSLNVKIITQDYEILRDVNIVQHGIMFDTVVIRRNITLQDSFHVVVGGYIQDFPCFPSLVDTLTGTIDKFTGKPNIYIAYGLNFGSECTRRRP